METKVNFALIGVFVLILSALLISGVLWLSSEKSYRKAYDTYLVHMDESVSGLSQDAPVRFRGVPVGGVRGIRLAPDNPELVELTLDIEHGTPVKQDTVAELVTQGLTGISHVELSGGSRNHPLLLPAPGEKYPLIRTKPSTLLRLDNAISPLLINLNRSSENFNALLNDENRIALHRTLVNLEQLTGALAKRSAAIDAGLKYASQTMQNTARLTAQAELELPRLQKRIQRSADTFDHVLAEAARTESSVSDTLEGMRAETLPEARQAIADLRELTATLLRLSVALERNPGMLIQGRPITPPGPGE
jgi:phospholipid/cholesterol/gamma-HCH transport system substrate-binding protein